MPNTPCLVGEGASAVSAGSKASRESVNRALAILQRWEKQWKFPSTP